MCPVCIATAAWIAASATSSGGVSALFVKKFRSKAQESTFNIVNQQGGEQHEPARPSEDENAPRRIAAGVGSGAPATAR